MLCFRILQSVRDLGLLSRAVGPKIVAHIPTKIENLPETEIRTKIDLTEITELRPRLLSIRHHQET